MKARVQFGIIIILLVLSSSLILAQNANPDNPLFSLKRAQESVFLTLKGNPRDKVDYMTHLLDVRLKEFESLTKAGGDHDMWSSSLRYSTFAGQITDLVIANNLSEMTGPIKKQFETQKTKLNELYVAFPKNTDNGEWKYILDAINYLNFNLDKLNKI